MPPIEIETTHVKISDGFVVFPVDCWMAASNWIGWNKDFECSSDIELPVLSEPSRFRQFWREYSLLQGEMDTDEQPRDRFREALKGFSAREDAEKAAENLKYKVEGSSKKHFSLITKLNAFRDPFQFIASDSLNRRGIRQITGSNPTSYKDQLCLCRNWRKTLEKSDFLNKVFRIKPWSEGYTSAFAMRVIDCGLMRVGRENR